ncbi:MAG: sulfatase-like hydrolase/transferase [Pseudomonadales bacterium]|nr:sulfatase-like hydrolase/transferase [Pseudomonadales bacterium]
MSKRDVVFGKFNLLVLLFVSSIYANLFFKKVSMFSYLQLNSEFNGLEPLSFFSYFDLARLEVTFPLALLTWLSAVLLVATQKNGLIRFFSVAIALFISLLHFVASKSSMFTKEPIAFNQLEFWGLPIGLESLPFIYLFVLPAGILLPSILWLIKHKRTPFSKSKVAWFMRAHLLAVGLFAFSFVPPFQDEMPHGISTNAMIYSIKTFIDSGEAFFQYNDKEVLTAHALAELDEAVDTAAPNVVIIILESTSASAVSLVEDRYRYPTSPFLKSLAKNSLVANNAYAIIPHTSKALTAINCGVEPGLSRPIYASILGVGVDCLPQLLSKKGYTSAFFQSPTGRFENRKELISRYGFDDFYAMENIDTDGFEVANYFGYEDRTLLKPSKEWLEKQEEPFLAVYLTGATHHDYIPPPSFETFEFLENSNVKDYNSYLNCIRYVDGFLAELFEQYKQLNQYDNTIFIVTGDHGEGFGEHVAVQHNNIIYNEGLKVPLIVHSKRFREQPVTLDKVVNHLDLLPTIIDLLPFNFSVQPNGESLLQKGDSERAVYSACYDDYRCLVRTDSRYKYIYKYGLASDELYDLIADPLERINLVGVEEKRVLRFRRDVQQWYNNVQSRFHNYAVTVDPNYRQRINETMPVDHDIAIELTKKRKEQRAEHDKI